MRPTTEQQQFLRDKLARATRYRETCAEFYDHIVSALETRPDTIPFTDTVESIIANELGGYEGMDRIETRYQRTATKEVKKRYLRYIGDYFKPTQFWVTLLLVILFYWVTKQVWFGFWIFICMILIMRMTPKMLKWGRNIFAGYIFTRPQRSVKDSVFEWLDYIAPILFALFIVCGAILGYSSPIAWFNTVSPIILIVLLVLCSVNSLAFYKVYRKEFKISISL